MQKILVRNAQTITVAGGKDYNDLENKPSINSVELEGNKTLHELGIQQEGNYLTEIPSDYKTKTENDLLYQAKGSYATTSDLATKQDKITSSNKLSSDLVSGLSTVATSGSYNDLSNKPTIPSEVTETTVANWGFTKNTGDYTKPATGIPSTDLSSAVQTSLGLADTAIQSSDLADVATTGDYDDLSNKPTITTIPTNVSSFTNDANYQNATQVQSAIDSVVGNINTILATLTTPQGGNE